MLWKNGYKIWGNVLFELDNIPALIFYNKYLGDKSIDFLSAALLCFLNLKTIVENQSFVRSMLNIWEEKIEKVSKAVGADTTNCGFYS